MSIRLPLQSFSFDLSNEVGAGSVAGGVGKLFTLPQDTDNVVVKMTASTVGGGVSATFQTSDDGGTTWFDVARTSVVSNANNTTAEWLSIPVISTGVAPLLFTGSTFGAIGSAAASSLGVKGVSGLPIMGLVNRIFLRLTGNISANATTVVTVKANSQSPTR